MQIHSETATVIAITQGQNMVMNQQSGGGMPSIETVTVTLRSDGGVQQAIQMPVEKMPPYGARITVTYDYTPEG